MKLTQPGSILSVIVSVFLFFPPVSSAQVLCGNIIAPQNWSNFFSELQTTPITNCSDPFSETLNLQSPYTLKINGSIINDGDIIEIEEGDAEDFIIEGTPLLTNVNHLFFLHNENGYQFVNTQPSTPSETDYRTLAQNFFPQGTDIEPFIMTITNGDYYFEDSEMQAQLFNFLDYVDQNFIPQSSFLGAGTYTLVSQEYLISVSGNNFFEKFFSSVIQTAHAQELPYNPKNIFTLTFTIIETPISLDGNSSIFFLPGIQASRLYKDGVLGTEDQIWEPNFNQDIIQLRMNELGESIEDIYTKDILDEVFGIRNIYAGFSHFLNGLVTDGVIESWKSYAYDWRYSVRDIAENGAKFKDGIKDPVFLIEELAKDSFSGKVTLIGHSNGGLLAKVIIEKLAREGKDSLVDRVIFVGSPQLGTPKAIASLLHGYDQQSLLGVIVDADTIRKTTRNMPGAMGLVPTGEYFRTDTDSIVTFDDKEGTALFRSIYGNAINDEAELLDFMSGEGDGRTDIPHSLHEAVKINRSIQNEAFEDHHNLLDNWTAPEHIVVTEIVGIGLNTLRGIQYREFIEKECTIDTGTIGGTRSCNEQKIYKPFPLFTLYGDETVTALSAEGYKGEKETYYIDLKLSRQLGEQVEHADLTELSYFNHLVRNIISGVTSNVETVSTNLDDIEGDYEIFGVHSPISISVSEDNGNTVERGNTRYPKEDIPGSEYLELGGSSYVIVPKEGEYKVTLKGAGYGGATLTLDEFDGSNQTSKISVFLATITPSTTINIAYDNNILGNLKIDQNGDGKVDVEMTPEGKIVEKMSTYQDLKNGISNLPLTKVSKATLLILVNVAEELHKKVKQNTKWKKLENAALTETELLFKLYVKKKLLTQLQTEPILQIIAKLKL